MLYTKQENYPLDSILPRWRWNSGEWLEERSHLPLMWKGKALFRAPTHLWKFVLSLTAAESAPT